MDLKVLIQGIKNLAGALKLSPIVAKGLKELWIAIFDTAIVLLVTFQLIPLLVDVYLSIADLGKLFSLIWKHLYKCCLNLQSKSRVKNNGRNMPGSKRYKYWDWEHPSNSLSRPSIWKTWLWTIFHSIFWKILVNKATGALYYSFGDAK